MSARQFYLGHFTKSALAMHVETCGSFARRTMPAPTIRLGNKRAVHGSFETSCRCEVLTSRSNSVPPPMRSMVRLALRKSATARPSTCAVPHQRWCNMIGREQGAPPIPSAKRPCISRSEHAAARNRRRACPGPAQRGWSPRHADDTKSRRPQRAQQASSPIRPTRFRPSSPKPTRPTPTSTASMSEPPVTSGRAPRNSPRYSMLPAANSARGRSESNVRVMVNNAPTRQQLKAGC